MRDPDKDDKVREWFYEFQKKRQNFYTWIELFNFAFFFQIDTLKEVVAFRIASSICTLIFAYFEPLNSSDGRKKN